MSSIFRKKWFKVVSLLLIWLLIGSFALYISIDSSDFFYLAIAFVINLTITFIFYSKLFSAKYISIPSNFFKAKPREVGLEKEEISQIRKPKIKLKKMFFIQSVFFVMFTALFFYLLTYKFNSAENKGLVLAYFSKLAEFIKSNWVLLIIPLILFFLSVIFNRAQAKLKRIATSLFMTSINVLISAFIALLLGLGVSFIEISLLKYQVSNKPNSINLYTNVEDILNSLKDFDNPPNIVGNDKDIEELIVVFRAKGKSNLFKEEIIPLVVGLTPFDMSLDKYSVLLVNETLVITELDKDKTETISPTVGKLFVKKTLAPNYIKEEPELSLMSRQEYLKYRDEQIDKAIEAVDSMLTEIQQSINTLYSNIQSDKNMIASNERSLNQSISERDDAYEYCMNAGYYSYYFDTFYRYYTDSYCESQKADWNSIIEGFRKNVSDWKSQLSYDQKQLKEFQEYKVLLEDHRSLIASQKESTVYELGLFEPDNLVKVVLEETDSASLADFYATLVHEYLHYTSYVSQERRLTSFFEEGLTEYFARETVKENLETETQLGYPLISALIKEMAKKIPHDKLEEIYFSKNQEALIQTLNQNFGDNFYEESELYFMLIYYLPSSETIDIANNVMFRLGGNELKEEDIFSRESKFE